MDISWSNKGYEDGRRWEEIARLINTTSPRNPPRGFLIHQCCWVLLSKQFKSGELDPEKFLETLREKPPQWYRDLYSRNMRECIVSFNCTLITKR